MIRYFKEHTTTDTGAWSEANSNGAHKATVHTHTAEFTIPSGTGSATVSLYGTNDPRSGATGSLIGTFTFAAAANGELATPITTQHAWEFVRSTCSAISGTGAAVRVAVAGA